MNDYECVLDFCSEVMSEADRKRLIQAIQEGKKIKTTINFFGDGDYNSINIGEEWGMSIVFNTNTMVGLGQDMGLTVDYSVPSEEDQEEILKDLNENGPDDSYNDYLKSSKDDFLE